jgi:prepilin-type N-terminal cleavage/methylation domain-containing protein
VMVRDVDRADDSGFTLVEFMVAMGVFAILLAIFATAIQSFSKSTVRSVQTSDQTTESRVVLDRFDKTLRSAAAITRPGLGLSGLNWYVEYRNDAVSPSICTQWVLRTDTDTLAERSWTTNVVPLPAAPAWRTVATHVVNTTDATQAPFTFIASTTTVPLQQLSVSLRFQQVNGPLTVAASTFAARNTSILTATNSTTTTLLCNDFGARP